MYGRVDINKYFNGARRLENFLVKPQGGVVRRSGSRFINASKDSSKLSRLIPFVFSNQQAYVLEFGDFYVRVYVNGGVVVHDLSSTSAWVTATDYALGDFVNDGVLVYRCILAHTSGAASQPGVGGSWATYWIQDSTLEVVTPWGQNDVGEISFTQSADVLYLAHGDYQTRKLLRYGNTDWRLELYAPLDGPYLDVDTSGNKITVEVVSDVTSLFTNITAETTLVATASLFVVGDVNKFVEYRDHVDSYGYVHHGLRKITAFTSATVVECSGLDEAVIFSGSYVTYSGLYRMPVVNANTVTQSGGTVTSVGAIFDSSSVGKYVRLTGSQSWWLVTALIDSRNVSATAVTIVSYTYPTIKVGVQTGLAAGDVGKYIDYPLGETWGLAKILSVTSFSECTVQVIDPIVNADNLVHISVPGNGGASANYAGVFSPKDLGRHVRDTWADTHAWIKILSYAGPQNVSGTQLTMFSYTYPSIVPELRGDRTITVKLTSVDALFTPNDIGKSMRLRFGSDWRCITITEYTSPTVVAGTSNGFIPWDESNASVLYNGGKADDFRIGAWSDDAGWPAIVGFHEQRLCFAKTSNQSQTLWLSVSADYENMAPSTPDGDVLADSAIYVTLVSGRANPITWIEAGPVMLVGTIGAEYQVKPSSLSEPLSPTNISVLPQTYYGSIEPENAQRSGSSTLFIQRGGNKVREMVYDFNIDAFAAKDLTIISEHILRDNGGGVESAFQDQPSGTMWIVTADGQLIAMTYEREHDVIAWHRHILGGTGVTVESVASIPSDNGDDVYVIVKRTINGGTKRYIEKLERDFDTSAGDTKSDMFFVDSGLTYDGAPTTIIAGLGHLEGETVQVVADGAYIGTKVVSSGQFTLSNAASVVHAGLAYTSLLETLDPEGGSPAGTSQGKLKRVSEVAARVKDSLPFKQGPSVSQLSVLPTQHFGDIDDTNSVYTGDVEFSPEQTYGHGRLVMTQSDPVPLIILALMLKLNTSE
jgi:hypothetical protein